MQSEDTTTDELVQSLIDAKSLNNEKLKANLSNTQKQILALV